MPALICKMTCTEGKCRNPVTKLIVVLYDKILVLSYEYIVIQIKDITSMIYYVVAKSIAGITENNFCYFV